MSSSGQLPSLAPAPTPQHILQPNQATMQAPGTPQAGGHPVMSPGGQPMIAAQAGQQIAPGQFIIPQVGTPNTATAAQAYTMPQIATYNQQGQLVLQPASYAFQAVPAATQQPGQQYILATPSSNLQGQKPGQPQMMAAASGTNTQANGKQQLAPMTQTTAAFALSTPVSPAVGTAGTPQTYIMANPMGGSLMATAQPIVSGASSSNIKSEPGKQGSQAIQQQAGQQGSATAGPQTAQQPIMLPQGMTYMNPQAPGQQAIFQNGQIIVRASAPQDGSQIMFSPTGQPLQQQAQLQVTSPQMGPPGLTPAMQPMAMAATSTAMRMPTNTATVPSHVPPGKTPISRTLAPLLPTTTTSRAGWVNPVTAGAQPSPKSKAKMSPRGTGQVGRPPGPAKSALNALKMQPPTANSPPARLPGPPTLPTPASPMALGPPVLQTSSPLPPNSASTPPHSQPPTLQPMMLPASSMPMATNQLGLKSTVTSKPPSLTANVPVSQVAGVPKDKQPMLPKKTDDKSKTDKDSNGDVDTPKAVVKPNVLTHVIDGHVIQESSQPFPMDDSKARNRRKSDNKPTSTTLPLPPQLTPSQLQNPGGNLPPFNTTSATTAPLPPLKTLTAPAAVPPAINGGKLNEDSLVSSIKKSEPEKKRGPGRPPGSTKQSIEQQRLLAAQQQQNKINDVPPLKKAKLDVEPAEKPTKDLGIPSVDMVTNNPLKWTVQQVCDFVKNLPGCSDYVEDFQLQEIDGQALMLLKADHLMSAMSIKLGPALKICSAIDAMREELKQN